MIVFELKQKTGLVNFVVFFFYFWKFGFMVSEFVVGSNEQDMYISNLLVSIWYCFVWKGLKPSW